MYLIAGEQLSFKPGRYGDGISSFPFLTRGIERKIKTRGQYFTLARCRCVFLCMHLEIFIPIQ